MGVLLKEGLRVAMAKVTYLICQVFACIK